MTTSNHSYVRAVGALLVLFAALTGRIDAGPLRDASADVQVDSEPVVTRLNEFATTDTQKTIVKTICDVLAGGGNATFLNGMPWDDEGNVLHWAARRGEISVFESLIRLPGVKVNEPGKSGKTALHFAAFAGHKGIVELLLTAPGINFNAQDEFWKTPLHAAVASRQPEIVEIVEMLVNHRHVAVNAGDRQLTTALHWSMVSNNVDVVKVLLNNTGIDVNPKDHHLATPLHWAASFGHNTLVELLVLDPRIIVNAVDDAKQTPLHKAVTNSRIAVVEILAEVGGIDTSLKDKDGKTALDLARERKLRSVERLLGGRGHFLSDIARGMKQCAGWLLELLNRPLTRWR